MTDDAIVIDDVKKRRKKINVYMIIWANQSQEILLYTLLQGRFSSSLSNISFIVTSGLESCKNECFWSNCDRYCIIVWAETI